MTSVQEFIVLKPVGKSVEVLDLPSRAPEFVKDRTWSGGRGEIGETPEFFFVYGYLIKRLLRRFLAYVKLISVSYSVVIDKFHLGLCCLNKRIYSISSFWRLFIWMQTVSNHMLFFISFLLKLRFKKSKLVTPESLVEKIPNSPRHRIY